MDALPSELLGGSILSKTSRCENVISFCASSRNACTRDVWRDALASWYNKSADGRDPKALFSNMCRAQRLDEVEFARTVWNAATRIRTRRAGLKDYQFGGHVFDVVSNPRVRYDRIRRRTDILDYNLVLMHNGVKILSTNQARDIHDAVLRILREG